MNPITYIELINAVETIITSPTYILLIATIAHIIIRNEYRKQIITLQQRAVIMDRYISENIQHKDDSQEVIQQASEITEVTEHTVTDASPDLDRAVIESVSGTDYKDLSDFDKNLLTKMLRSNWGRTLDQATGHIIS